MRKKPQLVIIGSGRAAWQLGIALKKKKFPIKQVCGRNGAAARALAKKLGCAAAGSLKKVDRRADLYLVAVPDDAIAAVARSLRLRGKILVHTSGSVEMDVLKKSAAHYGVLYPVQTLSRERMTDLSRVPFCIEFNDAEAGRMIARIASALSKLVYNLSSAGRARVHLAAVIASNFSNYFYAIAEDLLESEQLSLRMVQPLLLETVNKAVEKGAAASQTGPARRGDKKVMQKHLRMLKKDKELARLYRLVSAGIGKLK